MSSLYLSRARLAFLAFAALTTSAQPLGAQTAGSFASSFTVFLRGVPVGSEQISVERAADGLTITSSSRMGAPIDLVGRIVQVKYSGNWTPLELSVDATVQGQPLATHIVVNGTAANIETTAGGRGAQSTAAIAADALMLPSPFWGPFEALAERLQNAPAGSTIPLLAGQPATIQVGESSTESIQTPARIVHARATRIKLPVQATTQDAEIWADENGHLLRITIPVQNIEVVREDISSVAARRIIISRAGDEQARIAANGFALAGTISVPDATGQPAPAVVLVGGSGASDRDETTAGIPVFGQLANALADAGMLVVRYDKRGAGQSGGRTEAATLDDFADDLRAVVKSVADRKDVDRKRIAVVGYGDGSLVAMLAAAKEGRIGALALVGAAGIGGADLNLYQVGHQMDAAKRPEAEKQRALDLQKTIQRAVASGTGWEGVQPGLRQQADTPWFQSVLAFDPAKALSGVDQPVLIIQGDLDTTVPADSADTLAALANARKRAKPTDVVRLPGINHLLVPATTGETDEYDKLPDRHITPLAAQTIARWLQKTLPGK